MSPFTRYAFALLICIYGIYQMVNGHYFAGIVGILLAIFIGWLGGRR
jgi:hypothetical protein